MKDMLKVVDGGYLTWVYGSERFSQRSWVGVRSRFSTPAGAFIIMEGNHLFRREYFPDYKIGRTERRDGDDHREERYQNVKKFREEVFIADETLPTIHIHGHEADDLIAITLVAESFRKYWPLMVIGTDKDFLQLPNDRFILERVNGFQVTLPNFRKSWPKTLQPHIKDEEDVLLTLAIMGDSSDSVPRIAEPRKLAPVVEVLSSDDPFTLAREIYGDSFLRNLYLVILPGPWVFDHIPTELELFDLLASGMGTDFEKFGLKYNREILEGLETRAEIAMEGLKNVDHKEQQLWIDVLNQISKRR